MPGTKPKLDSEFLLNQFQLIRAKYLFSFSYSLLFHFLNFARVEKLYAPLQQGYFKAMIFSASDWQHQWIIILQFCDFKHFT